MITAINWWKRESECFAITFVLIMRTSLGLVGPALEAWNAQDLRERLTITGIKALPERQPVACAPISSCMSPPDWG
jgi:hypothetical protein